MVNKISAVINTFNEENSIKRAIESVKWADEIVVCDMHSSDKTASIAQKMGAKVVEYEFHEFVESARNFATSEAKGDWILILDPDEEVGGELGERLKEIASKMSGISYVRLPRKNLIFGKWMKASGWWPDYNIRFFRKGKVEWTNRIHRPPKVEGEGIELESKEELAITHHHYQSISQFLGRMERYTKVQAEELIQDGYNFDYKDLISKPLGEFLGRFFAQKGYMDGVHGLALSLLQAFSFLIVYLRVWEMEKYKEQEFNAKDLEALSKNSGKEINYWFKYGNLSKNTFKRFFQKVKNRI